MRSSLQPGPCSLLPAAHQQSRKGSWLLADNRCREDNRTSKQQQLTATLSSWLNAFSSVTFNAYRCPSLSRSASYLWQRAFQHSDNLLQST